MASSPSPSPAVVPDPAPQSSSDRNSKCKADGDDALDPETIKKRKEALDREAQDCQKHSMYLGRLLDFVIPQNVINRKYTLHGSIDRLEKLVPWGDL